MELLIPWCVCQRGGGNVVEENEAGGQLRLGEGAGRVEESLQEGER